LPDVLHRGRRADVALRGSRVVLRSLLARRFQTVTTSITVAIAVGLLLTIMSMRDATKQTLERGAGNMHLVVSAEPSSLVSVLNSVFHAGTPSQAMPWLSVQQLQRDPRVAYAMPIQQGDSFDRFPVTAVLPEFFNRFSPDPRFDPDGSDRGTPWRASRGRLLEDRFEAVLGSQVARESGLDIGDMIVLTCGLAGVGMVHEGFAYEIVGVMPPGFAFPNWHDAWIPLELDRATAPYATQSLQGIGRLRAGVSRSDAAAALDSLAERELVDHDGRKVGKGNAKDHGKAFSVYFSDPYGHRLEITTYEHEVVRSTT